MTLVVALVPLVAFGVLVLVGGIDAYTDTYDSIAGWMPSRFFTTASPTVDPCFEGLITTGHPNCWLT